MMARGKNGAKTQRVILSTTPQVCEVLERFVETGFYGKNPAEVAEQMLRTHLLRLRKTGEWPEELSAVLADE